MTEIPDDVFDEMRRERVEIHPKLGEIKGPGTLPCEQHCDVPEGVTLVGVPTPRHDWKDIIVCPNEGCGRAWLVLEDVRE